MLTWIYSRTGFVNSKMTLLPEATGDAMGNDKSTATTQATIMSRPFYLAHLLATIDKTEARQSPAGPELPTSPDVAAPILDFDYVLHAVVNRWLYVFQNRQGKWTWAAEYWVDTKGGYHPVNLELQEGKERKERHKRPEPAKEVLPLLRFPYQINGKRITYAFCLSGTRLSLHSIQRLEKDGNNLLDGRLLDDELAKGPYDSGKGTYQSINEYQTDKNTGGTFIGVKDELWYTISLNTVMQKVRDVAIGWTAPAADLPDETRKRAEQRAKKKLLSEVIKQLVEKNPKLRDKLHPHPLPNFAADAETVMSKWLEDYEKSAQCLAAIAGDAAGHLIEELLSPRMAFVRDSYESLKGVDPQGFVQDMPLFLDEWSRCIDRLVETLPGVAFLLSILKDKHHFVHDYALVQKAPEGLLYKVIYKSGAATFSILKELVLPAFYSRGAPAAKMVVDAFNNLTFSEGLAILRPRNLILPNPIRTKSVGVLRTSRVLEWETEIIAVPDNWAKDVKIPKDLLDRVTFALKSLNLLLSIDKLVQSKGKGTGKQVWAAVSTLGSAASTVSSVPAVTSGLSDLSKRRIKAIGGISAFIETIVPFKELGEKSSVGDINAAVGAGIVGGGSALTTLGTGMVYLGVETAWAQAGVVLGIAGGVLVALGWLVEFFSTDTPLELFVSHSLWGDRARPIGSGETDSGKTSWSVVPFEDWDENTEKGLDYQVAAMINLLAAFSLSYDWGKRRMRITLGLTHPHTQVYIKSDFGNASVLKDGRVVFNIGGNKYRLVVWINYAYRVVYVRFMGTHTQYDRIDAQTI